MVHGGEWMLMIVPNGGAKPKNSMKPYQATVNAISSDYNHHNFPLNHKINTWDHHNFP
jgi:hypothetical protein